MMEAVFIPLLIILVLIIFNAIFVAAEFSIVSVPRTKIAQLSDKGSLSARHVFTILLDPGEQNKYITTAQLGITLVSLGLGMYGEHILAEWLLQPLEGLGWFAPALAHSLATIFSVVILTYLHVVLGEMVPKSMALQEPQATVLFLDRFMATLEIIFLPVVAILNWLGNLIVKLIGVPEAAQSTRVFTSDELEYIVDESSEKGLLEPAEQLFIQNILDLQERTVEQVMTPRPKVIGIPVGATKDVILNRICGTRKSRYPIFDQDLDNIIGILHIKTLARFVMNHPESEPDLASMAREVIYVPVTLPLDKMLARFRSEHRQFAIVVDEYGGTAGIVTLEDLQEEVVGEIQDEFDKEIAPIQVLSSSTLRVRGDLILDELTQLFDLELEHPEAFTVGGLIMNLLGRIPRPRDIVNYKKVKFEVEMVDGLAVQSALLHLPEEIIPYLETT